MDKLKSRKLWLALAGAVLVVLNDYFQWGFGKDAIDNVLKFFGMFILAEGAADVTKALNK